MPQPAPPAIALSRAQVREIDRRSIEDYHIPGVVLMENAARAVTDVALDMLRDAGRSVALIVCGGGNNGGDGLAVARHLTNHGVDVVIVPAVNPAHYRGDARIQWRIARAMQLPTIDQPGAGTGRPTGLVIDALFGTGLQEPPRVMDWIDWMNRRNVPILAVDLPSGMDADTGQPLGPACVRATRTVTFVAPKLGFTDPRARDFLGQVTVGDIGCPRELIEAVAAREI